MSLSTAQLEAILLKLHEYSSGATNFLISLLPITILSSPSSSAMTRGIQNDKVFPAPVAAASNPSHILACPQCQRDFDLKPAWPLTELCFNKISNLFDRPVARRWRCLRGHRNE